MSGLESKVKGKKLIKDLPILWKGPKEISITGISEDSRKIVPGNLFIARKGEHFDGAKMIPQAVENGAICVLTDVYDPFLPTAQWIVDDVKKWIAVLAERFYQKPAEKLFMMGITGTNGKTTTSYLVHHLCNALGKKTGLMGTIERWIDEIRIPSNLTTEDILSNQKHLREMVELGLKAAVMEVSSHALSQKRVEGILFDVSMFTNLSPEHLDYHKSMENYAASKKKLFTNHTKKVAILNRDDPYYALMQKGIKTVLSYGFSEEADVRIVSFKSSLEGSFFTLSFQGEKEDFWIPLIGKYNIFNATLAIAAGLFQGFSMKEMAQALQSFPGVPGRMQRVFDRFFVDYAHTPDALEKALKTLRSLSQNTLIVVFGCGGNRDQTKRAKMAKIAEAYADYTIVTSDNPRSEDPEKIVEDIQKGFQKTDYCIEIDRKEAIKKAVSMSNQATLLIAGKGHEKTQEFRHKTIFFDDVNILEETLCHANLS